MKTERIQRILRQAGWPIPRDGQYGPKTKEAVADFQRAFAWWKRGLRVDGIAGRRTEKALRWCANHGYKISPHFHASEFASKGNGWIKISRYLLRSLEKLRRKVGPIRIMSGYRDPYHNDVTIGGASRSQHKLGLAIDPSSPLPLAQVLAVRRFSGIGVRGTTTQVLHVDCRHRGPWNNGGTPLRPVRWSY